MPILICIVGLFGLFAFGTVASNISYYTLNLSGFLRDVSLTLVIIGALGLLLELSEFAGYFEERLLRVIVQEQFLLKLDSDQLRDLSMSAIRACVAKASRNPAYQAEQVFDQVYTDIVPLIGKVYREGYRETVEIIPLTAAEVEKRLGLTTGTIEVGSRVTFTRTTTEFTLVGPTADKETKEPYSWWTRLNKIEGLAATKPQNYVKVRMKLGDSQWEQVPLKLLEEIEDDARFGFNTEIKFRGKIRVVMEDDEFSLGNYDYFVKKMVHLILQRDFRLTAVSVGDAHDAIGRRRNSRAEGD